MFQNKHLILKYFYNICGNYNTVFSQESSLKFQKEQEIYLVQKCNNYRDLPHGILLL